MDPKNVKLTTSQKIIPFLKAVNDELPWQLVLIVVVSLFCGFYLPTFIPISAEMVAKYPFADIFARRILAGALVSTVMFFLTAGIVALADGVVAPLIKRIKSNFEEHALVEKKKILDNVIEDEVLTK